MFQEFELHVLVENGDWSWRNLSVSSIDILQNYNLPVTPTITKGWAAKIEKTTEPKTEARRTSLTP